ncbi:FAD dependent oxidoreductase-domain-containing protein [Naematelia encephala]|uniref:FAD dependent oxidoreductase-domain-containing protein n=1 Tax=Naematelia encephala TaxID=71784 RepID=A0A1Y2AQZ7_9TREE|nr:FAD dependent oxidoreductase-domain-containing protein [Naematelia encephala]
MTMDSSLLLPVPNRLEPFWLQERDVQLKSARTTVDIPSTCDVVIIGSGLTGAMAAWNVYQELEDCQKRANVVMLEADEVCGSATARNGGHCKPLTFIGYRAEASKHGAEIANQLLRFEAGALEMYAKLVEEEDIDCDMHVTRAFDICFTAEGSDSAKKDWDARMAAYPDCMRDSDVRRVDDKQTLESLTGVQGGLWGASYPAGHLWPYKLAASLIRKCIAKGMNLQTYTPATHLFASPAGWTIETPRGNINTKSVVIATNAYTSSILPEFKTKILPVRGSACSITPAPSHSAGAVPGPLRYTYGLRFGTGEVDYMIPRQGRGRIPGRGDQSYILGGAKGCFLSNLDEWYNNKRDNEEMPGVREYFEGYMAKYFAKWDGNENGNVDRVWSGVLGYSADLLPYVGEVPDRPGVFICAGFTGHGMPRIPGCTAAVSKLVSAFVIDSAITPSVQSQFEASLPKPYWMTKDRLVSKQNLIKSAMGQLVDEEVINARGKEEHLNTVCKDLRDL